MASCGLGRLIADGDGEEVFVRAGASGSSTPLIAGRRFEFIAATIRGRRIVLKIWAAT